MLGIYYVIVEMLVIYLHPKLATGLNRVIAKDVENCTCCQMCDNYRMSRKICPGTKQAQFITMYIKTKVVQSKGRLSAIDEI